MAVMLNEQSYEYATKLINDRKIVLDESDDWSRHQPTAAQEDQFIRDRGYQEYEKWHLGIDDSETPIRKHRYYFLYGDFEKVHRGAVLTAEFRASLCRYLTIKWAAAHLHAMLDEVR